jgi:membrane protease YdiL (CAAX protease family)
MSVDITSAPLVAQRRSLFALVLSWTVIVGLAAGIIYSNVRAGESVPIQRLMNKERARMVGLIVVQMMSLPKEAGASSGLVQQRVSTLIGQLEADARTVEDRIRVAILTGESQGADSAQKKLSDISSGTLGAEASQDVQSIQTIYNEGVGGLDTGERDALIQRHGYLGRLALAYRVPADQEPRKTLETEALWFWIRLTVVGIGLMLAVGVSVAVFILACVWFVKGKLRPSYIPASSHGSAFLEAFALYLVLFVTLGVLLRYAGPVSLQWNWLALAILPIIWVWVRLRGTTAEERSVAFGWNRGRGFFREVGAGIVGYLGGIIVIAVGCVITLILVRITGAQAASPIVQELGGGPLRLVGLYAMACIFAPFVEETMFRGLLFHHLRQRWSWVVTAVIVSVIFAALHPQGWVAVPALTAIAMVLAALREWRGSLIAPMAAHACNNFLVLTLALLFLK